ncbi:MAG: hypothetical protein INR62_07040 [Rhodospirillales bacterium]|nr:hypothetical protein [Acetobacter sp.]
MTRTSFLHHLAIGCAFLLVGCAETVTEYRPGSDGRYHKVGTFTPDESWKRRVNEEIAQEKAGTLQKPSYETTKQYWQSRYRGIRSHPGVGWKSAEFKTSEDLVSYIKQQRRAAGLPTYD